MENPSFYTYLHCRPDGSPFYVGKGSGCRSYEFSSSRSKYHKSIVAKYGRENIGIFIFPCESEEQSFQDEIQQIAQLRREGYELCNHTDGGEGKSGCVVSQQTRKKLSAANMGKACSAATREKIAVSAIGNRRGVGNKGSPGRVHSEEEKRKRVASNTGKKRTPEQKTKFCIAQQKIAHLKRGKKLSAETCAKLSAIRTGQNNHMTGKKHSAESREKMSIAAKARCERNK